MADKRRPALVPWSALLSGGMAKDFQRRCCTQMSWILLGLYSDTMS